MEMVNSQLSVKQPSFEQPSFEQPSFEIDQYWLILKRRFVPALGIFLLIVVLGTVKTIFKKPIYEARASLKLRTINPSSSLTTDISKEIGVLSPLADKSNPLITEAEVIRSQPLIEKTISELQLTDDLGQPSTVEEILEALNVKEVSSTDILRISYQHTDPKLAAQIVNTLVNNYIDNNTQVNRSEAVLAREFLQKQLPKAEKNLEELEASILKIQQENQIISLEEESASIAKSLQEVRRSIAETRSQLANSRSKSEYISNQLGVNSQQALIATAVNQSSAVEQSLQKLQELESQLAEQQGRFTETNPKIIKLKEQIILQQELVEKQITDVAGNQAKNLFNSSQLGTKQQELASELVKLEANNIGLVKQLESLTQIEKIQQQRANILPKLGFQLRQLERKLAVSQDSYNLLLNKLNNIEIAENQNIGNVRVLSTATVPQKPINSRAIGYMASIFLGLISAVGVIYILEIMDRSLKTVEDAKQLLGYTGLGIIPEIDRTKLPILSISNNADSTVPIAIVKHYPASAISECYRILHSNLKFLCSDKKINTVVITSSTSGEGKSSIAANLASAMAQVGKKVLLLDANLHAPIQHRIWDVYTKPGLSNFITEKLTIDSVTHKVMTNLDLIASGTIPSSPATLLDSQRMKSLIDHCETIYDFIIIDSPALNKAADALTLGVMADGVLLTLKQGHVKSSEAKFAQELLEQSGQNILGIVFNGVNSSVESHNYTYQALENLHHNDHPLQILEPDRVQILEPDRVQILDADRDSMRETVSSHQKDSSINKFNYDLNLEEIEQTTIEELEHIILEWQKNLAQVTRIVREQEDELFLLEQNVRQLRKKVDLASDDNRIFLAEQLSQEQERQNMLNETLVGQRRNLKKRKQLLLLLLQYQELLQ